MNKFCPICKAECSDNCALFVDSEEQCSLRLLAVAADLIRYRVEDVAVLKAERLRAEKAPGYWGQRMAQARQERRNGDSHEG